jgi:predicted ATPase
LDRVRATEPRFAPDPRAAAAIAAICRRLDGIPLAIELAAAHVAVLGLDDVAARLNDRFQLLRGGRRTALPRHQTLRATFDWSYELLADPERILLRRLGIFPGFFDLEAARAVAADADLIPVSIVVGLSDLVAKSMIAGHLDTASTRYRLLETTRAYALEKLDEHDECEQLARRHAEYIRQLFERAEADLETRPAAEWPADYGRYIDDLRASLDWSFSPHGDTATGVAITVASLQLWLQLSLMAECRRHVERALASISGQGTRGEMQLQAALGLSLNYTTGRTPGKEAALTRALEIAENLGDTEYQLLALRGLWAYRVDTGAYRMALALAEQFTELAATAGELTYLAIGDRMAAIALYVLGDQTHARRRLEHHLARPFPPLRHSRIVRFLMDPRVAIRTHLARILWCQGFPVQAAETAQLAVEDAEQKGHTISLCHALAQAACPVALYTGDLPAAERFAAILLGHAGKLRLAGWIARGHCLEATTLIVRGNFADGLPLLRTAIAELREEGPTPGYTAFLAVLARGLGQSGQLTEGLPAIEQALALSEQYEERWNLPELLRIKGELLLLDDAAGAAISAENCFRQALNWAGRDGALSWELRAATSLGRLWRDLGRGMEAHDLVASVYGRFTEGFDTADLKTARALLDLLSMPSSPV